MTGPSGATIAVSEHAAYFVGKFRRQWGAEPTANLAVGLTRQQHEPRPNCGACDQLWAYHAMAYLRSIGQPGAG